MTGKYDSTQLGFLDGIASVTAKCVTLVSIDYRLSARIGDPRGIPSKRVYLMRLVDAYRIAWIGSLIASAIVLQRMTPEWQRAVIVLAAFRVAEVLATGVRLFLLPEGSAGTNSFQRSTLIAMSSLATLVLAFANLYLAVGGVQTSGEHPQPLTHAIDSIYFSAVTIATVGYGDFVPATRAARSLVVAEIAAGLLMLAEIVPYLVSKLESRSLGESAARRPFDEGSH